PLPGRTHHRPAPRVMTQTVKGRMCRRSVTACAWKDILPFKSDVPRLAFQAVLKNDGKVLHARGRRTLHQPGGGEPHNKKVRCKGTDPFRPPVNGRRLVLPAGRPPRGAATRRKYARTSIRLMLLSAGCWGRRPAPHPAPRKFRRASGVGSRKRLQPTKKNTLLAGFCQGNFCACQAPIEMSPSFPR